MILDGMFKRSIENPNTSLADPADWLINSWGGGPTSAGMSVNEYSALKFTAVWGCIRILAESVAVLPLTLYRTDGKTKEIARTHPSYRLMHNAPNEDMTSYIFRETKQAHVAAWGNGYSYIKRDNGLRPVGLYPLMPDKTSAARRNGRLIYVTQTDHGQVTIDPMNILHIPGLGFDGVMGYSPINMHREAIGLGLAAQEFGATFFGNGATLSGVLEHPQALDDEGIARLKKQWANAHQGSKKAHGTAVLEQGMKYARIGIPPEDAQFLETRKFQITDIARIYRIPPHMLADLERATFSNIEQQDLNFVKHTMLPWLVRWEQELDRKLLSESERGEYYFKFNVEGLLRGDTAARSAYYREMFNIGTMSQNDIREKEDMNPIDGGDKYLVPLNMAPIGSDESKNSNQRKFIEAEAGRIAWKEITAFRKEAERKDDESFEAWLETFLKDHVSHVSSHMHVDVEIAERYVERMKARIADDSQMDTWEETSRNELIALVKET